MSKIEGVDVALRFVSGSSPFPALCFESNVSEGKQKQFSKSSPFSNEAAGFGFKFRNFFIQTPKGSTRPSGLSPFPALCFESNVSEGKLCVLKVT